MNDPTKPGPDADRIAELKREIAELEAANAAASGWWAAVGARLEQITECKAELSRLRNKQPKGDERPKLRLEEDAQGKRAMLGGYQMPNELIPSLEAETLSPAPSPEPQDVREKVTLNDCPPGLFMFNGTLGFKSEYKTESAGGGWQVDAYVVESGEYFWGGALNSKERGKLLVEPIPALAQSDAQPVGDEATIVDEAYQVIATLANTFGVFEHPDVIRALDRMAYGKTEDGTPLLPWPREHLRLATTPPALPEGAREALERARRFIQGVMSDVKFKVTDRDHVGLLQPAIDDIQTALASTPTSSSAGLIEAAEIAEQHHPNIPALVDFAQKLRAVAAVRNNPEAFARLKALRLRAADRSAPRSDRSGA